MANMSVTSTDGRVDIIKAPDGLVADSGNNSGYQQGKGHSSEVEDVVSIGIPLSTAEKLQNAKDEVELLQVLGIGEGKARELVGQNFKELPGERIGEKDYVFEAAREVVIDMLSAHVGNEDDIAVFRTFESRLHDKIREKESDPVNREKNKEVSQTDTGSN
jgi:hypothetical protein